MFFSAFSIYSKLLFFQNSQKQRTLEYFSELSQDVIAKLYKIYELDFEMFEYEKFV